MAVTPTADAPSQKGPPRLGIDADDRRQLRGQELRDRAASGAVLIAVRSAAVLALGLLGYLVFARVLSPAEFGVGALGLSITFFGHFLADAGIGPALLRRQDAPTRMELASVAGFQLAVMSLAMVVVGLWAFLFRSHTAAVAAVFLAGLPFLAVRVPAAIMLERGLHYRPIVLSEFIEVLVFNVVAVIAVLLGSGVFGLAGASIVKSLAGTLALARLAPGLMLRPTFRVAPLRGLMAFGLTFQASTVVSLARDGLFNVGIAAIGGYTLLGFWAVASRLMSIPASIFEAVSRVSFPALSRLLGNGEDPRQPIERGLALGAILATSLLTPLATAGSDALAGVLGHQWREAGTVLPTICLATSIGMPISVVATGFLYALGDARTVLTANLALTAAAFAAGLVLLPLTGYQGLGGALMVGTFVDAWLLSRALQRHAEVRTLPHLVRPVAAGVLGYVAGSLASSLISGPLPAAAVAAATSVAVYFGCLALVDRSELAVAGRLVGRSLRRAAGARSPEAPGDDE